MNDSQQSSAVRLLAEGSYFSGVLRPVAIDWCPQPDITPYELARLMPLLFLMIRFPVLPTQLPTEPKLLRHLRIIDPNKQGD